jgi:hypothetical protein
MRFGALVIILAVLGVVVYQLYDFYHDKVGYTPSRAIEDYFHALAAGDYDEVYRLTAKTDLTDIYGRPITKDEFIAQLVRVTGGRQLPFRSIEMVKIHERQGSQLYLVKLQSSMAGGAGQARVVVEVRREGKIWVVTYPFAIML